jgi:hypothetical protein
MAGVRILLQRRIVLGYPDNFPANSSVMYPLNMSIPSLGIVSGLVEVIVYSRNITGTGATVTIGVSNAATTSDGRIAAGTNAQFTGSVQLVVGTTTTPTLYTGALSAPIASQLMGLAVFASAAGAAGDGEVEFEAWLVGRDA